MSFGANVYARHIIGLKPRDNSSGLRCYRKEVLEAIDFDALHSKGYSFLEELLYRCQEKGFRISEIPFIFKDREKGKSKISGKEVVIAAYTLLKMKLGW